MIETCTDPTSWTIRARTSERVNGYEEDYIEFSHSYAQLRFLITGYRSVTPRSGEEYSIGFYFLSPCCAGDIIASSSRDLYCVSEGNPSIKAICEFCGNCYNKDITSDFIKSATIDESNLTIEFYEKGVNVGKTWPEFFNQAINCFEEVDVLTTCLLTMELTALMPFWAVRMKEYLSVS